MGECDLLGLRKILSDFGLDVDEQHELGLVVKVLNDKHLYCLGMLDNLLG